MSRYIPGSGPMNAKLVVITEAPTWDDSEKGKLHTGGEGKAIHSMLRDAGISPSDCWFTTVSKEFVPPQPRDFPKPFTLRAKEVNVDVDKYIAELAVEIKSIKPNCILALGSSVLWATTGKGKLQSNRGSIFKTLGTKLVSTYHPGGLTNTVRPEFAGYYNKQIIKFDFARAWAESRFSEYNPPSRNLQVCRNSEQLSAFLIRNSAKKKMASDIESIACIPGCIGLAFDRFSGLTVPLWNHSNISDIPSSDLAQIWYILAKVLFEKEIIGQNFKYDEDKIRRLGFRIRKLCSDTMLKAFAINPELPKSLAFNTSIYTKEPFYKDEGMYEGSREDLFIGCARDSCVTFEIDEEMDKDLDEIGQRPFFENFLMDLHGLYLEIENEGFAVNPDTRDKLLEKYIKWDEKLSYERWKLVGAHVNPNSPKQMQILLFETMGLPRKKGTGEEELTVLLSQCKEKDHIKIMENILTTRRVRKTIGTYLMAMPDYDQRMRTTYFICLETGRTGTGQQDPPIRPMVEGLIDADGKKKKKAMGTAFQTMTKHGDIGEDVRSMYVP